MADELRTNRTDPEVDRAIDLLDAAQDHLQNRRPEPAVAIWQQLISDGGMAGDFAHVSYAEHLFDQGEDDQAWGELAAVMLEGRIFSLPWLSAAELLEERGDLGDALYWYRAATACLTEEELAIPNGPSWARDVRAGQRRLKWRMGIPLDDADLLAEMGEDESEDKAAPLYELLAEPTVIEGRLQCLSRGEFTNVHARWARYVIGKEENEYFEDVERVLQADVASRIVVVPHTLHSWVVVEDAVYNNVKHMTQFRSVAASYEGEGVDWPPGRNQACWCGSGTKYKKCCGANRVAA